MDSYSVYLAGEKIGTAEVSRQGLYYRIRCLCDINGNIPLRIKVAGEREADLGLCVPLAGCFGLEVSISAKRIGEGELFFTAVPGNSRTQQIMSVTPDKPFAYISRLKDAYFIRQGQLGCIGIHITGQFQDQQDNDRNP